MSPSWVGVGVLGGWWWSEWCGVEVGKFWGGAMGGGDWMDMHGGGGKGMLASSSSSSSSSSSTPQTSAVCFQIKHFNVSMHRASD